MKASIRHLTQAELAERWNKSIHTIERYRTDKVGPPYLKIGGKVMYRIQDIEQFEAERIFIGPNDPPIGTAEKKGMTISEALQLLGEHESLMKKN